MQKVYIPDMDHHFQQTQVQIFFTTVNTTSDMGIKVKVKISLFQAVEAHRVARG
jgi:hypothetical protein